MAKVLLVDRLYGSPQWDLGSGWLGAEHEMVRPPDYELGTILSLLPDVEGILTVFREVGPEMMDAAPGLKVVAKPGIGYDNIDAAAATARGIMVCNVTGVRGRAVAEHAFFMMLYLARNAWMLDDPAWEHTDAVQLGGKTIGIVGLGDIGRHTALIADGFGMKVLAHTRTPDPSRLPDVDVEFLSFDALLPRSNFLVLCMPLLPETQGILNAAALKRMKKDAMLVNVARGPVAVTEDILQALQQGEIAAAALDVTDPEPLPDDHPLRKMNNVLITPHHASRTPETQVAAIERTRENVSRALAGERPINIVNPEVLER
ncbi:MAG: NAD(P)-dependent oxidoreductase [bacterium]|nr:NAD(P)-dependent oxidoreductase [bacterium]